MARKTQATSNRNVGAPHRHIEARDDREAFAISLLDELWTRYRARVPYVQVYERLVSEAGDSFVNDHVAFRTLGLESPFAGIATIGRLFEALGYQAAGCYVFPDKHLASLHFQHPNPLFPKLFISELRTWELSDKVQRVLGRATAGRGQGPSMRDLARATNVAGLPSLERSVLLERLIKFFEKRPWSTPRRRDVELVDEESQFGAWVLAHGYKVNHFTALINSHRTEKMGDIEKTAAAMAKAGVPMKDAIEGELGSKLRQTATGAALVDVQVREKGKTATMPWPYAYFELAERGQFIDPTTQKTFRFEGFLGPQAAQLFEMTRSR